MSHHESDSPASIRSSRPTGADWVFLFFLVCLFAAVLAMGTLTFRQGLKTEAGKTQAEALVSWLAQSKDSRGRAGFEPSACAFSRADSTQPPTWAGCAEVLFSQGGPVGDLRNPFSGQPLSPIARCDPVDPKSPGQLVLEKISATPLGSAVSSVTVALMAEEPIDKPLTIKVTVCDKGGYPIKVAEVEF
jgi:hypothetical protein